MTMVQRNTETASPSEKSGVSELALQWQAISTAPKDGTPVLTCSARERNVMYVAWFGQQQDIWTFYANGRGEKHGFYPTHWMPLPAPPASASEVSDDR